MSDRIPSEVTVRVYSARNLQKDVAGCVTIKLGKEKFKTSVSEKSSRPEWNEECPLKVKDPTEAVKIVLTDKESGTVIGLIRWVVLDLPTTPKGRKWIPVHPKKDKTTNNISPSGLGELCVEMFVSKTVDASTVSDKKWKHFKGTLKGLGHSSSSGGGGGVESKSSNNLTVVEGQGGVSRSPSIQTLNATAISNNNNNSHDHHSNSHTNNNTNYNNSTTTTTNNNTSTNSTSNNNNNNNNNNNPSSTNNSNTLSPPASAESEPHNRNSGPLDLTKKIIKSAANGISGGSSSSTSSSTAPEATSLSPKEGSELGGTKVTIKGSKFGSSEEDVLAVTFGDYDCVGSLEWITSSKISVISPPSKVVGKVPVVIQTKDGKSTNNLFFTYEAAPENLPNRPQVSGISPNNGPAGGSTHVSIRGIHLGTDAYDVIGLTINGVDTLSTMTWVSPTQIKCTTKPGKEGTGDVLVTTRSGGHGVSTVTYTYNPPLKMKPADSNSTPNETAADSAAATVNDENYENMSKSRLISEIHGLKNKLKALTSENEAMKEYIDALIIKMLDMDVSMLEK